MHTSGLDIFLLFILPLAGGIATYFYYQKKKFNLKNILAFSGAFLLAICLLHLLPEIFKAEESYTGYFVLLGFIIQLVLEYFSRGIEHGHIHTHGDHHHVETSIFLSLFIHSLIEGAALITHHHEGEAHSNSLLLGIIIHKIPIAVVLAMLLSSIKSKLSNAVLVLVLFSLASPLGYYISVWFDLDNIISPTQLLAVVVGIFLHVSTTILFESEENHKINIQKAISILVGLALGILAS